MAGRKCEARNEKTMREKLAAEILDASNNTGAAVKKREDTHKMAESTRLLHITDGKYGNRDKLRITVSFRL